jgi:putative MATE family efflux protein
MQSLFQKIKSILKLFVAALRGEDREYTTGSINKAIFMLSIPMIAEMVMESLFAIVDIYFVSKVGVNAVAAVALTESVLTIVYSIAIGLSMAVTAIIARRVGERKKKRAADAAFQGILMGLVVGLLLGTTGYFFAEDILLIMGGEPSVIEEGKRYTELMFLSNVSIILLFLINGIYRGAGDASIAMRSLWLANGLNIVLDPILIFGLGPIPAMGIEGAAIATIIGRTSGVFYQVYFLVNGRSVLLFTVKNLVVRIKTIREILRISAAGMGQFLVESASWIFLVRVMSNFGAEALAGYTIAFRVIIFTILPSWGMANAAATLVGQNLGAGSPERAERSVWRTAHWNMVFLGGISVIFYLFSLPILMFFSEDQSVLQVGASALKIICLGYVFFAYGMVISQAFNGAGDTRTPLVVNIGVFWLLQIPMAYLMAVVWDWQAEGVFISIALCHSLHALICIWLFRRGRWKLVKV